MKCKEKIDSVGC